MKREIFCINRHATDCCPGHSKWPDDVYRSNRSIRARSRDKKREHRYVRRVNKQLLLQEIESEVS